MQSTQNNGPVARFIQNNFLQLVIFLITFTIAWTLLKSGLQAVSIQAQNNKEDITKLTELVERITILEENRTSTNSNIQDIKEDIREIKLFLNVPIQ